MIILTKLYPLLVGAVLSVLMPQAYADAVEAAGVVISTEGEVHAFSTDEKDKRKLERGNDFFPKDTIVTAADSHVSFRFHDATMMELKEKSQYKVSKFSYDKDKPEKDSFVGELVAGGFRTITGELGSRNPNAYEVKTRFTTLTISGTEYSFSIDRDVDAFVTKGSIKLAVSCEHDQLICGQHIVLDEKHPGVVVNPNGQFQRVSMIPHNLVQGFRTDGFKALHKESVAYKKSSTKAPTVRVRGSGNAEPPKKPVGGGACGVRTAM